MAAAGSREPRRLTSLFSPCRGGLSGGRQEQGPRPRTRPGLKVKECLELQGQPEVGAPEGRARHRGVRPRRLRSEQAWRGKRPPPPSRVWPPRRPSRRQRPGRRQPLTTRPSPLAPPAARRAVPGRRTQHTPGPRPPPEARPALPAVGGRRGPPQRLLGDVVLGRSLAGRPGESLVTWEWRRGSREV